MWHPLPSEIKQRHGDSGQQLWTLALLVGVGGAAGILVEDPKQGETQHGLQG